MAKAIISVYDKTGIVDFSSSLTGLGYEIISSGGTARLLEEHKINVTSVSDFTHSPEMLDGRVKTLHPKIYAGILSDRDNDTHRNEIEKLGYDFIDMVVVNLYPFEETVAKSDVTLDMAIEQIDIGGVTLIRAAAKNFKHVIIVTDISDYNMIIEKLKKFKKIDLKTKKQLAVKAFKHTMLYDKAISNFLEAYIID